MFHRSWGLACTFGAIVVPFLVLAQQPAPTSKPSKPEALSALWQDLVELDGEKAFRAMRRLAAIPETIGFLRATVPAAAKTATSKQIEDLIRQLDSERFAERDKARQELERLDWQAVKALRQAAARSGTLERKRRIEQLIARTEGPPTGANLRWHRTVEIVEWIGTPEAKAILERWGQGAPEGRLTQEANKARKRWGTRTESLPLAKRETVDAQGDPLPAGAILRLGSMRWRMDAGGAVIPRNLFHRLARKSLRIKLLRH